jgi:uncharacterized membrane protein
MTFSLNEWINLVVRWMHVFAGILWIGQTYFFTWLEGRLSEEEHAAASPNPGAQVWMVHSGGFYVVEKQKVAAMLPGRLHWFRWEAALTFLSGMFLLVQIYYMGGLMTDDSVANISLGKAIAIGMAAWILGWVVYDVLVNSPLGKSEGAFAVVAYGLVVAIAYGLTHVLSGRAAYIHLGAVFGTIMAANVWMRILPAQRRMVTALKEGRTPDMSWAARAKLRSKHNTFMVVPVVSIMLSNHFPTASYGNRYNWQILSALVLAGWGAAKLIRRA